MEFDEIKELIEVVSSSGISFFELTTDDVHIKMDKSLDRIAGSSNNENEESAAREVSLDNEEKLYVANTELKEETKQETEGIDENIAIIKAPMVGTFYTSSAQGGKAFIDKGDRVNKGDVLCIIEAMKLMNEIESEYSGIVESVLVNDGEMVEYGQTMFKIKED